MMKSYKSTQEIHRKIQKKIIKKNKKWTTTHTTIQE